MPPATATGTGPSWSSCAGEGAGTVLIDPVACPDLSALDAALAGVEAVLHAASQDLPCLAELGLPAAPAVRHRARRAAARLPAGRPRHAGGDRARLHAGKGALGGGLVHPAAAHRVAPLRRAGRRGPGRAARRPGRPSWPSRARPSGPGRSSPRCSRPSRQPPRPDPWRRTSGIHRVHTPPGPGRRPRALARARQDRTRRDLSPGRVLPDSAIVEAARGLPGSERDLTELPGFRGRGARRHASEWRRAVNRARAQAEPNLPGHGVPAARGPAARPPLGGAGPGGRPAARGRAHGGRRGRR